MSQCWQALRHEVFVMYHLVYNLFDFFNNRIFFKILFQERTSILYLWDVHTKKLNNFDINLKEHLTWCGWSRISSFLAIGTSKGSLIIYNYEHSKRVPLIGKHAKRITCGAWNSQNLIAIGSDDKTISLSNVAGDELRRVSLRAEPDNLKMSNIKQAYCKAYYESSVSSILGKRSIFLWDTEEDEIANNQQVFFQFQCTLFMSQINQ